METVTNTQTFVVTPLNTIKENMKNFDWLYEHLANLTFKVKSSDVHKTIELKKYDPGKTEYILKQIDEAGFIPAPSPYVLGLGVQYSDTIKKYEYIVSLDENNILTDHQSNPCFLSIFKAEDKNGIGMTPCKDWWYGKRWFAVIRKEPLVS